jgi:Pyridoxal-phosphate dependent enzyme/ACT domain
MIEAADVDAARARLAGTVHETPCAYSETLSTLTGARVFLKLENLQMTGSFKERGAANLLLQLSPDERRRGVVAASAGNHGLAVALHAARLRVAAVIVMPEWAPLAKVTAARRHGAEVVLHGDNFDEAYTRAREIEANRRLVFVHPFVIARVIERGLVKDGRLVRLRMRLRDRPGALARLTALVAEARANVLHIEHDRASSRAPVGDSEVALTLETSGRPQIEAIKQHLADAGYAAEEV